MRYNLGNITFRCLGLKAAWYLCKTTMYLTYVALLVKRRSYKDALTHDPLARWQVFNLKRQLVMDPP